MRQRREHKLRYEWERVMRRLALPRSVKHIGSLCAQFGNLDGREIRPGEKRLALETGFTDRTVRSALRTLRDVGMLRRTRMGSAMGRRALADEYELAIPEDIADRVHEWNVRANRAPLGLVDDGKGTHLSQSKKAGRKRAGSPEIASGDIDPQKARKPAPEAKDHRKLVSGDNQEHRKITTRITGNQLPPTTPVTTPAKPPHQTPGSSEDQPLTSRASQSADEFEIDKGEGKRPTCPHGNSGRKRRDGKPRCPQCRDASVTQPPAPATGKCQEHPAMKGGNRLDGKPNCPVCRATERWAS